MSYLVGNQNYTNMRIAHNRTPLEKEKLVLEMYEEIKNATEVGRRLDLAKPTVLSILHRYDIKVWTYTEVHGITKGIEKEVCKLYKQGLSSYKIGNKLELERTTITRILKRNKIEIRKSNDRFYTYQINDNFFEKIDNESKAYFLGLMVADGCVRNNGSVGINLQESDLHILELFKKELEYSGPILDISRTKKNPNWANQRNLHFTSKKISEDLQKYGLIQNKTHSTYFPDIPEELHPHFIRGVFDGDGCICFTGGKYIFNIAGNNLLVEKIQEILIEKCNLNKTTIRHPKKEAPNVSVMVYAGNRQVKRIGEYLYKDANFYIQRKYDKFKQITVIWKT